jgi:hypothetical protein
VKSWGSLFGFVFAVTLAQPSEARTVTLLDGRLSFTVPNDFSTGNPGELSPKYSVLTLLNSPDQRLLVWVTYSKHVQKLADAKVFLRYKIAEHSRGENKYRYFQWLTHRIVKRDGRDWAEVSFTHDVSTPVGTDAYTRCISTFSDGRLLEIWALTRAAKDPEQRSTVDRIIELSETPLVKQASPAQLRRRDRRRGFGLSCSGHYVWAQGFVTWRCRFWSCLWIRDSAV